MKTDTTRGPSPAAHPIEVVENAVRVLLMLKSRRSLRVSEVAAELGVARSSAHRMLTTLQAQGMLTQDAATRAYQAGPELVQLGLCVIGAVDLRGQARSTLEDLVRQTGETAHLIVLDGTDIVFVDGVESNQVIRAALRTGVRAPAHPSAAGKALLAELPVDQLRTRYPTARLSGGTQRAISTRSALERELEAVRQRGFAVNFAESEDGVHAIAATVHDLHGLVRCALSVSGPSGRLHETDADEIAAILIDRAHQLGERLG